MIDNIGMLSDLYSYGNIAFVGGGFQKSGIHNILEPAAHGKPVFFGPEYQKFKEAHDLISFQSAFSVAEHIDGKRLMQKLIINHSLLDAAGKSASHYIQTNVGATEKIFQHIFRKSKEMKKPGTQQIIEY